MPYFSQRSENKLITVVEDLQRVCRAVIQYYDFTVIWGERPEDIQNEIFRQGFSKLKFPYSPHNKCPSLAVDVAPYPINWKDIRRFDILSGRMMEAADLMAIEIRWGGDWDGDDDLKDQTFNDLGHFELVKQPILTLNLSEESKET